MMTMPWLLCLPLLGGFAGAPPVATVESPQITWKAPTSYLEGSPFVVDIEIVAPSGGSVCAGWLLTAAAFYVDGKALDERGERGSMQLPEGTKITLGVNISPYLTGQLAGKSSFQLGYAKGIASDETLEVNILQAAPPGLDFMNMPVEELTDYNVVLQTNRGDMVIELWPDVAPLHSRNFLDLSYPGSGPNGGAFYDGLLFHRVLPNFMIQGGDPTGWGSGRGPRMLTAEFSDKPHERGVLSMARNPEDPNSASCQFFVVQIRRPDLDGEYTAFGKLVSGYEVLDAIATAPGERIEKVGGFRPDKPQRILKANVVLAQTGG